MIQSATGTQPVIVAVGVVYFALVVAISIWAGRRTRTARDFFVAGGGIGLTVLALSSMSATISGFAFIGGPALVYTMGLGGVFIVLPAAITSSLVAWVLARRMRLLAEVRGVMTIPDAIGARYNSPAAQGLTALAILVAVIGYTATNILALGVVVHSIFGVGLAWGIWIGMAITLLYSASGGILAGVYNDVMQGTLMAVASVLVFLFVLRTGNEVGGFAHVLLQDDASFLSPWGTGSPLAALSLFFVFGMGALGQPHVIHKFYMLRDPRRLRWYPALMTGTLVLTLLLYVGVGVAVKALVANGDLAPLTAPDDATPTFLLGYTPILLAALVFSGVAAAIMSTVNSFLSVGAAAISHDIPIAFGRRVGDELRVGRLATVVISVSAAILAQLSGSMVAFLGIFGWGLFASTIVPALAIGLNWRGATRAGAIASIATGLVVTLLFETLGYTGAYSFPAGVTISGLSLVLSMLVFFGVSWMTRSSAAANLPVDVAAVMEG